MKKKSEENRSEAINSKNTNKKIHEEENFSELNEDINEDKIQNQISIEEIEEIKNKEIENLKQEKLRLLADIENERKSNLKDIENSIKYSNKKILSKILPLIQNYDIALKVAEKINNETVNKFLSGLKMTVNDLKLSLENEGIKEYSPVPKKDLWDSRFCEVIKEVENDDYEQGTILEVLQKGYFLHERILITAKVSISKKSVQK